MAGNWNVEHLEIRLGAYTSQKLAPAGTFACVRLLTGYFGSRLSALNSSDLQWPILLRLSHLQKRTDQRT
jgi:hypothetical protein